MYIPDPYKNTSKEEVKRFIQENGFGTLILQNTNEVPDIEDGTKDDNKTWKIQELNTTRKTLSRHLPFVVDLDSEHYHDGKNFETLTAHMGIHYPIYNCFNEKKNETPLPGAEGDEALVIFQGPNSYMSPTWYDNMEGATWNYISVHVYGRIERLGGKDLQKMIETLLYKYEKQYKTDPRLTLDTIRSRYDYLKHHIGGVRIHIDNFKVDVQAAYKLSQDQNDWSRKNAIEHLRATEYPNAIAIADEMEKRNTNVQRGEV